MKETEWTLNFDTTHFVAVASGHSVRTQVLFATTSGDISGEEKRDVIGFHGSENGEAINSINYKSSTPIQFSGGEVIYVWIKATTWSGGASITNMKADGSQDTIPTKLSATKIGL